MGLEDLKLALSAALTETPPRRDKGQPRLPIDRVFTAPGFGTVVTGTLSDGQLHAGDEVEIVPAGLKARIRGLQTHKRSVETGLPGSRLAINLTGLHPDQLRRGMVVARPGALRPATLVDARLRLVRPGLGQAVVRHGQAVEFFSGAAEVTARVRLLDAEQLAAGETGWVQLALEAPAALATGDRFIIRQPSPSVTLGGGTIVNPYPRRRWRRFHDETLLQLETLAQGTPEDLLLHAAAGLEPAPLKALADASGLDAAATEQVLTELTAAGQLLLLGPAQPPLAKSPANAITLGGWNTLAARLAETLQEYHALFPLRPGMGREEHKNRLQGRQKWPAKLFNELIARAAAEGVLEERGDFLARPDHTIAFSAAQQARVDGLIAEFRRQPFAPPSAAEATGLADPDIISALLHLGVLVRLNPEVLLLRETYDEMAAGVKGFIAEHGSMTVAQVRDRFNTSRKYALALMEHLDEQKVTRRVGDERVLR